MGYPFETIYPSATRDTVMKDILIFFFGKQNLYTSINQGTELSTLSVYPNPAKNELSIVMPIQGKSTLFIYNMLGQQVFSTCFSGNNSIEMTNVQSLPAGTYVLRLESGDQNFAGKFIKM